MHVQTSLPPRATRKAGPLLARFTALAHWAERHCRRAEDGRCEALTTVGDLAALWDCSHRAAQQTLRALAGRGLVSWEPRPGRGRRSVLRVAVHPVHAYLDRARAAQRREQWAEAAFWLGEILRECPCIPEVPAMLAEARARLGLGPDPAPVGSPAGRGDDCCRPAAGDNREPATPSHACSR